MRKIATKTEIISLLMICSSFFAAVSAQTLLDARTHPKFVNKLPIPSVIDGRTGGTFIVGISEFNQWLGLVDPVTNLPMTTKVWGYNGTYPGPTFAAMKNVPIEVYWQNNLVDNNGQPIPHFLPVDPSVHWAFGHDPNWASYGVPVVTHLHGGHTESASDGLPDQWFTPGFALKGHGFVKGDLEPYHYQNDQEAATIWYHDHALGITRLNVYAGLAGFYVITDNNEINLQQTNKIPSGPYDMGLAIQDRLFTEDGQLHFPSILDMENHMMPDDDMDVHQIPNPSVLPEFFGDFILVNGMTWPVLDVEPRQYRFRVLNGSDSRFYNLFLSGSQIIYEIASDNGLLPSPVALNQMLIAPGERKDIVIDFSNLAGQTLILRNNAKTPFPMGETVNPHTTGRIMAFRVSKPLNPDYPMTQLPATLRPPIVRLQTNLPPRKLVLFEATDEFGRLKPMLGTVDDGVIPYDGAITENPALNSIEIWEIYNETMDAHPIHLHMVTMQMINRQRFKADVDQENGKPNNIRLLGQPKGPEADEVGWKDTWIMYPGEVTRVIAKFDREGLYAWHCHILSHEDHEMMRPYYVGDMPEHEDMERSISIVSEMEKNQVQIMPNPFSNTATALLNLERDAQIEIYLFDITGKMVTSLYAGERTAGYHTFPLDGTSLASGLYFCVININGQRIVKKILVQK
ncbi:MAG TPA: multicopper oxidase domain-containing protein [Lunatimonas sp.]|nr:multicopper oxidase domain-containing protein [Lunatimonas sp.]